MSAVGRLMRSQQIAAPTHCVVHRVTVCVDTCQLYECLVCAALWRVRSLASSCQAWANAVPLTHN
jgi:hypothetical protein